MADRVEHLPWCANSCPAGQLGGRHRGLVTPVGDDPKWPIATVYVELDGVLRVCMAAGLRQSWTLEEAARVGAAITEVAAEAARLEVRV